MAEPTVAWSQGDGEAPFVFFADHASNTIPDAYEGLGLPGDLLQTHVAWDLGAAALTEALHARLGGVAHFCGFSRLLIDPNRSLDRPDLVPPQSDQIPIPGNVELAYAERERRIHDYFEPYHQSLDRTLAQQGALHQDLFVTSLHSFTPRLVGEFEDRPWHVGVLWRHDEGSAQVFMDLMRKETDWVIGDNKPYDAHGFNYTVDRHIAPRRLPHLTLEVRQDMLASAEQVETMADALETGIRFCQRWSAKGGSPP